MLRVVVPIYWVQQFKTKPDKVHLNNLNFYRNAHYMTLNNMKRDVTEIILNQLDGFGPILDPYTAQYDLYYKNPTCDGGNSVAVIEKVFLDAIQQAGLVREDNVKHNVGATWKVCGQDRDNPRIEITIHPAELISD